MGVVRNFNALARAHKIDGMHAHHIPAAYGLNADLRLGSFANNAIAGRTTHVVEFPTARISQAFAQGQGRAAGAVLLTAVVQFNHFNVVGIAQSARQLRQNLAQHIDAYAHVGRPENRRALCQFAKLVFFSISKARGADNKSIPAFSHSSR